MVCTLYIVFLHKFINSNVIDGSFIVQGVQLFCLDIENHIESNLQTITTNCERLNILVNKEPAHRRPNSKM